jgi:hypothetical protein
VLEKTTDQNYTLLKIMPRLTGAQRQKKLQKRTKTLRETQEKATNQRTASASKTRAASAARNARRGDAINKSADGTRTRMTEKAATATKLNKEAIKIQKDVDKKNKKIGKKKSRHTKITTWRDLE